MVTLTITHGSITYQPVVVGNIRWETERKGSPGKLTFTVLSWGEGLQEGDVARLDVNGQGLFYGFIFSRKPKKSGEIAVTAYDQTRYLKNKDTYVYQDATATDLVRMIAGDFQLQTGTLEDTVYRIPSRVEEDSTLMDMIQSALDLTLTNTGALYVLYDDMGHITLKGLASMRLDILIDQDVAQDYEYKSSIDEVTYNRIKLTFDNEETGKRDVYIAQSGENMNKWGVLQYFDTLQEGENGQHKADALLSLYNQESRKLSITGALGDVRIRAGSMPIVSLDLGDIQLHNYMLVEKCSHTFSLDEHKMDLTLRGGIING